MATIRIGTRRSTLARAQSQLVADALTRKTPSLTVELVGLDTEGDRTAGPLADCGGKGLFTRRLEEALDNGEIDLAVHSAKDLPAKLDERYALAAFPPRADARDVLVTPAGLSPENIPAGARVGTGSPRRAALLQALQPGAEVVPIRGNVDTRLSRAIGDRADLDGVILAAAGLQRLGRMETLGRQVHILDPERFIPAGGQGALACQMRADREDVFAIAQALDDPTTRTAVEAERAFLRMVGADCHSCVGVHVTATEIGWRCRAMVRDEVSGDLIVICEDAAEAQTASDRAVERARRSGR
ncbi:MAG: hydroxymethylbilane synthase [Phycisphaerae bacterium]